MPRKEETKTVRLSVKNNKRLLKIAELRKQSAYTVINSFIEELWLKQADEDNNL